ncbi:MAG: NADH-quinone oxidoreductase subunit L [Proteobacteria bacterium]|nr:NADH-quinone oxidoreductase subunit L [Pseudomonadota bacterium]
MKTNLIFLIPLLPLLGALFNLFLGRVIWRVAAGRDPSRRVVHFVAVGTVVASFAVALSLLVGPLFELFWKWHQGGKSGLSEALTQSVYTWIEVGNLKLDLAFRMDTLSGVMVMVVTFVGSLIHLYSTGYMADEPRYAAYFGYLNLFTGAMLILVLGDNLPVMFIGWEGVGLCSYLLIGFWFENNQFAYAGRKAFVVNRIGDFAFLIGMFLLFQAVGGLDYETLRSDAAMAAYRSPLWGERLAFWAGLFLFIGACGKSAQIPLYVWLPDAMAGPTPVSALIHAATMVTAGVYMVARMSFLYASSTAAMAVVAGVGALTALFAAIMAFAQTDFKKVLAYSTVSQLGFMFVGVGVGAYVAGIFHLVTHAFFKAGLFLAAGSVMHAMSGSGDIVKMGGLKKWLPWTHKTFVAYWLAICGIIPFAGFFSKDEILAGAWSAEGQGWLVGYGELLWVVLTVAALGTAFYMSRLYCLVFEGECRADDETRSHIHESPWSMTVPLAILAVFSVGIGFIGLPHVGGLPNVLESWLSASIARPDFHSTYPSIAESLHLSAQNHLGEGGLLLFMAIALVMGIAGIGAAWKLYRKGPSKLVADKSASGFAARIYQVVYNKFYVDELYDRIVVAPFRWACQALFDVVDKFVIDLIFVNGSAFVVGVVGRVARWVQNGQVHRYLGLLVVGAGCIFYFTREPTIDFSYTVSGGRVTFQADIGAGPSAIMSKTTELRWDFNGDGDSNDPEEQRFRNKTEAQLPIADVGSQVTLWYTDPVFKSTAKTVKPVDKNSDRVGGEQ